MRESINSQLTTVNYPLMDWARALFDNQPMVASRDSFGHRLKALRLASGKNLVDLSEDVFRTTGVRVSPQAMNKWEHGGAIKEQHLEAVARYFGRSPAWFRYEIDLDTPVDEVDITIVRLLKRAPVVSKRELLDYLRFRVDNLSTAEIAGEERARYSAELAQAAEELKRHER